MKHGIFWFLHLNIVIFVARIATIPLGIAGFFINVYSPLFVIVWALCGICAVITLVSLGIRAPTTSAMEKYIEDYHREFEDRQIKEFSQRHRQVKVLILRCYEYGKFSCVLNKRVIYGTLVMMALVTATDGMWIVKETKPLINDKPGETTVYRMNHAAHLRVEKIPDPNDNARLVINDGETEIDVVTHDDFHLTDFISTLNA